MIEKWWAYAPVLLVAALAGLTYWLDLAVQPDPAKTNVNQPDFIVEGMHAIKMNLDGSPRYAVMADKVVHYQDEASDTLLDHPTLTRYGEKAPMTIRSKEGRLSPDGADAYFIGDVFVRQPATAQDPEMTLSTSYLHVIPDRDLAKTDREVTMTRGKSTMKGVGLEFNNETRMAKLLSKVRGTLETPRKGPLLPWERTPR
ncbi:MAG TPA: LPS export ABC transporter periplasmic protein LptC [Burkholderiales bacterium]|nr:LPS export ABC transporter periplasmic protein LptC [Burkholderiales bacterium]